MLGVGGGVGGVWRSCAGIGCELGELVLGVGGAGVGCGLVLGVSARIECEFGVGVWISSWARVGSCVRVGRELGV